MIDIVKGLILSYIIGSIPTAYILGKFLYKVDIRNHGSGNIGSTNALRIFGFRSALLILLIDVFKGSIPVFLFGYHYAPVAILGHIFPIFLNLRGGKGVATLLGSLIFLDLNMAWLFISCFILVLILTKYSSLSSIISIITVTFYHLTTDIESAIFMLPLYILIIYKHSDNIKRLMRSEEHKININFLK